MIVICIHIGESNFQFMFSIFMPLGTASSASDDFTSFRHTSRKYFITSHHFWLPRWTDTFNHHHHSGYVLLGQKEQKSASTGGCDTEGKSFCLSGYLLVCSYAGKFYFILSRVEFNFLLVPLTSPYDLSFLFFHR